MNQLRTMENKDLLAYERLCSICYTYPAGHDAPSELPEDKLRIRRGVFDASGHLLSAMMQIPYQLRFCNQTVNMVGIGGVVTDPTARAQGAIRSLFEADLPTLYREGHVFSALYPFSYRFYGKFGYIWARFGRNMEIARDAIRSDLRRAEEIVRVLPGEDDQGMAAIYAQYVADKDFAVLRDEDMWAQKRKGTPWDDLKYAYVLRIAGEPVAYWIGSMQKGRNGAKLTLTDFAWTTQAGLEAIFAMIRGMNEVGTVRMQVRSGLELALLCNEAWDVDAKEDCQGMVRVVNAEQALALLPAPLLPGRLTLAVTDGQIPENCATFTVLGDGQTLTVTREAQAEADIRCDIRGLSALVVGRHRFGDAVALGLVELLHTENERFAQLLFAERRLHLNWDF